MRSTLSELGTTTKITDDTRILLQTEAGSVSIDIGSIHALRSVNAVSYSHGDIIYPLSLPVGNYRFLPGAQVYSLPHSGYYSTVAAADLEVFIPGRSLRLTIWAYHTTKKEMWPFLFELIAAADSGGVSASAFWSLVGPTDLAASNPGIRTTATTITSVIE